METLGTITLDYNESGTLLTGTFKPEAFTKGLIDVRPLPEGEPTDHAQTIISAWFQRQNDIELADNEKYKIETTLETCDKWPNGHYRQAVLTVKFIQREEAFAAVR